MASTCTASAASTSSSSSSVEPEDVPVRKHVAVDLQPCVEAAKAYLVATMAWAAAGEKLANALNVAVKQFQLESDTDDERHLLHQLEKYVQIQKKTNRIVHDDVVLDGFADGVVLALDDLSCTPPRTPLFDNTYRMRVLQVARQASLWQKSITAHLNRFNVDAEVVVSAAEEGMHLAIGDCQSQFYYRCFPDPRQLSQSTASKNGGSPSAVSGVEKWAKWILSDPVVVTCVVPCVEGTECDDDEALAELHNQRQQLLQSTSEGHRRRNSNTGAAPGAPINSSPDELPWGADVFFVTSSGALCYGQIGSTGAQPQTTLLNQQVIHSEKVLNVCCGRYHAVVVTSAGHVYSWGYSGLGQLGHGDTDDRTTPTRVEGSQKQASPFPSHVPAKSFGSSTIVQIACGGDHTLALSSDGQVWSWGSSGCGQLGLGIAGAPVAQPEPVSVKLFCESSNGREGGQSFSAAGNAGSAGSLHRSARDDRLTGFTPEPIPDTRVRSVYCGQLTSFLVMRWDSRVMCMGDGRYARGMTGVDAHIPSPVTGIPPVLELFCGARHVLALQAEKPRGHRLHSAESQDNDADDSNFAFAGGSSSDESGPVLWGWGDNSCNQLGRTSGFGVCRPFVLYRPRSHRVHHPVTWLGGLLTRALQADTSTASRNAPARSFNNFQEPGVSGVDDGTMRFTQVFARGNMSAVVTSHSIAVIWGGDGVSASPFSAEGRRGNEATITPGGVHGPGNTEANSAIRAQERDARVLYLQEPVRLAHVGPRTILLASVKQRVGGEGSSALFASLVDNSIDGNFETLNAHLQNEMEAKQQHRERQQQNSRRQRAERVGNVAKQGPKSMVSPLYDPSFNRSLRNLAGAVSTLDGEKLNPIAPAVANAAAAAAAAAATATKAATPAKPRRFPLLKRSAKEKDKAADVFSPSASPMLPARSSGNGPAGGLSEGSARPTLSFVLDDAESAKQQVLLADRKKSLEEQDGVQRTFSYRLEAHWDEKAHAVANTVASHGVPPQHRRVAWPLFIGNSAGLPSQAFDFYLTKARLELASQHLLGEDFRNCGSPRNSSMQGIDSGGGDERSVGTAAIMRRFEDVFSPTELNQFEPGFVLQQRVEQSVSLIANDLSRVFRAMSSSVPLDLLKARVRRLLLAHWALHRYLGYYQPMVYPAFLLTMVLPAQPSLRFRCFANLMQRPYFALMFDQVSSRRHGLRVNFFALFDQVLAHHCSGNIGVLLAEAVGDCSEQFTGFGDRIALFMRWFQCLFISVLPFSTALRVWDTFLASGSPAVDANPSAGALCVITTAVALVCRVAAEFALLRQQKAKELADAAVMARRAAEMSAATGVGGSIMLPRRRAPFSKDLDGDGLIKLLVATVDKRTRWMREAWARAADATALFDEANKVHLLPEEAAKLRNIFAEAVRG